MLAGPFLRAAAQLACFVQLITSARAECFTPATTEQQLKKGSSWRSHLQVQSSLLAFTVLLCPAVKSTKLRVREKENEWGAIFIAYSTQIEADLIKQRQVV